MPLSKSEKTYIQTSLQSPSPSRADGRPLYDYRSIAIETGVAPLANGSVRVNIGKNSSSGGGTEVLGAVKLEVENVCGKTDGRIVCSVSCSPSAYPHLSTGALDDLQYDYTTLLHQTLSHPSLHPSNLGIIKGKKAWLLSLDLVVLSDSGNVYDALFMAARAALWDTKVPRTRSIEYRANAKGGAQFGGGRADMDVDEDNKSGFDTRQVAAATDFELEDYWDEGEVLNGREKWPVCVTLNLFPPIHYLDATSQEEAATPFRLLLIYSGANLQGMRLLGSGEVNLDLMKSLINTGEKYASELSGALTVKLNDEDVRRNEKARSRFAATLSRPTALVPAAKI